MIRDVIRKQIRPILEKYEVSEEQLHEREPASIRALYDIYMLGSEFTSYCFIKAYINEKVVIPYLARKRHLELTDPIGLRKGYFFKYEVNFIIAALNKGLSYEKIALEINRHPLSVKNKIQNMRRDERMQVPRLYRKSI